MKFLFILFTFLGSNAFSARTKADLKLSVQDSSICVADLSQVQCWGSTPAAGLASGYKNIHQLQQNGYEACSIDDSGLWCWGGEVQSPLINPPPLQNIREFQLANSQACAIDEEGVKCWGFEGLVSDPPPGLKNPASLVVSEKQSCVLDEGTVKCWGDYSFVPAERLKNPRKLFRGDNIICAVDDLGVMCWGPADHQVLQVRIDIKNPSEMAFSTTYGCAIENETVKCWGGRLNDLFKIPVNLKNPRSLSISNRGVGCVVDDEDIKCWGEQVDLNGVTNHFRYLNTDIVDIGVYKGKTCVLAKTSAGCWGNDIGIDGRKSYIDGLVHPTAFAVGSNNAFVIDQKGLNITGDNFLGSAIPPDFTSLRLVSATGYHACGVDLNGVRCWGWGLDGSQLYPIKNVTEIVLSADGFCVIEGGAVNCPGGVPADIKKPAQITAGVGHVCVMDEGRIKCWSVNDYGKMHGQIDVPQNLKTPRWVQALPYSTCAMDAGGLKCWGLELNIPRNINLKSVQKIVSSGEHTCVLESEGLKCWGNNTYGQSLIPKDIWHETPNQKIVL